MSKNVEQRKLTARVASLIRGPKPDTEPSCLGIEIITITEREDSGLGGSKTSLGVGGAGGSKPRLARKRPSNNVDWDENASKQSERKKSNIGLRALEKRTPCPNVVAGKDGVIRSLDSSSGGRRRDDGRSSGAGGKKETSGRKQSSKSNRVRNNPEAVATERNWESPLDDTNKSVRPALTAPVESQLLESSQPKTDDEFSRSSRLLLQRQTDIVNSDDITVEARLRQSELFAEDTDDYLFDFEIIDVTNIVAMTKVLTSDSDSGVCLATSRDRDSAQRASSLLIQFDPFQKHYVNANDSTRQRHTIDNKNDNDNGGSNFDRENIRFQDEKAMDVQYALIADKDGDRPLHIAVVHQDVVLVRQLCALVKSVGATLDMYNCLHQTPLHLAAILGDQHMCEALLEEGSKPYLRDRNGDTALHLAVKFKSVDCLNVILRSKLTKNILNERNYEGLSPLHIAVAQEELVSAFYLVKAGCNINIQEGKSGRTPLINAVLCGKFDVVRILVKLGASLLSTDYAGANASQIANELENRDICLYLESKMASLRA